MSFKASAWAVEQKVGNSTAKILLLTLAEAASIEDASCFPSRATLADRIEASVDTVDRALRFLEQAGFITITRRQRPNRSDSSNVYTVNLSREPQNAASRTAMRPPQPHSYAALPSRTAMRPQVTGQSEQSQEQVNSCRVGNSTPKPANTSLEPAAAPNNPNLEANPEAEPTGQGRETPPVPRPPLTKKTTTRTKDTSRARNPLLDALAALGGASLEHMTPTEWGRAAKALKDIRSVKPDLTVEDIRIASDNYTKLYGSAYLTSTALSNNWSKVRPGVVVAERTQSPAQKPPTRWEIEKEIERISMALSVHEGYIDSTKCDLMTRTPEQKADADALIEKRKALRAKLLTFPSAP